MKIGLISDVHGESCSLRKALNLLAGTDVILCAGDLVDKGPDSAGALRIIQREAIPTVQGNHDRMARATQEFRELIGGAPDGSDTLTPDAVAALEALPPERRFTFAGTELLLTHAAPWPGWDYLWPSSYREVFERAAEYAPQGVLVMGHTHEPMRVDVGQTTILNPGSVCGHETHGSYTCAILTLPQRTFEVFNLRNARPYPFEQHTY